MHHPQDCRQSCCRRHQTRKKQELWRMLVGHCQQLSADTHRRKGKHWPLYGPLRSFIFTFVAVILSSLLTASLCSLSTTTQSQNLQHELNDGISDYKVMILKPYTLEVTAIPQTICPDIPVSERRILCWPRNM